MLRIIGIDPGSRQTGYGLIDSDGMHSVYLTHGVLKLSGQPLPPRLGEIFSAVTHLIQEYQPQVMAIEEVFVAKNPASALKLGQARGAAICAAVDRGLSVVEYTPTRIKQAVVGTGRADKEQIQHMVKMILGLRERPQADAADALAVALSHAHTHTTLARQASQGKRGI
ncbi:MAG: crossover junction endodeoxyribonuclease RuvC [Candidatus Thiodiazotropha sp.]